MDLLTLRYFFYFFLLYLCGHDLITPIPETKRKRHDMTPVSKSVASSGLLKPIKGMLRNVLVLVCT